MGSTTLKLKNEQSGTTFDAVAGSNLTLDGSDNSISLAGGAVVSTLTGSAGNDTIILNAGGGTLDGVEGVEKIFGDSGIDTIIVTDAIGTLISTGTGDDTVTGGAGDDTILAKNGADTVDGGAGDDTITGGNGADILTGSTGNDTFIYSFANHFGDTITDFETGSLNDVIDFSVAVSGGSGFEKLNSGTLAGTTGVLAYFDGSLTGVAAADEGNIISALNIDITFGTGESLLIAVGGGSADSALWYWDDGGGNSDGTIDAGEFTLVTELDSVDVNNMVADNFEGFT